jgi:hypothetical protein
MTQTLPETLKHRTIFSPDRAHRYTLWRDLGGGVGTCMFAMLNPSTADETKDDPTVRRAAGFARLWGYRYLAVGNIFALRATNPKELYKHPDPEGPENLRWFCDMAEYADLVIMAYGVHGALGNQGRMYCSALQNLGVQMHALKLTKGGLPGHPLYLPGNAMPFEVTA